MAMRVAEMPKTICMMVSKSMMYVWLWQMELLEEVGEAWM
jgi:hypothetical protein